MCGGVGIYVDDDEYAMAAGGVRILPFAKHFGEVEYEEAIQP